MPEKQEATEIERPLARVVLKRNGAGYKVTVNGIDMSDLVGAVELYVEGGEPAMVNLWVPAEVEIDLPADLDIYVVEPEEAEAATDDAEV